MAQEQYVLVHRGLQKKETITNTQKTYTSKKEAVDAMIQSIYFVQQQQYRDNKDNVNWEEDEDDAKNCIHLCESDGGFYYQMQRLHYYDLWYIFPDGECDFFMDMENMYEE